MTKRVALTAVLVLRAVCPARPPAAADAAARRDSLAPAPVALDEQDAARLSFGLALGLWSREAPGAALEQLALAEPARLDADAAARTRLLQALAAAAAGDTRGLNALLDAPPLSAAPALDLIALASGVDPGHDATGAPPLLAALAVERALAANDLDRAAATLAECAGRLPEALRLQLAARLADRRGDADAGARWLALARHRVRADWERPWWRTPRSAPWRATPRPNWRPLPMRRTRCACARWRTWPPATAWERAHRWPRCRRTIRPRCCAPASRSTRTIPTPPGAISRRSRPRVQRNAGGWSRSTPTPRRTRCSPWRRAAGSASRPGAATPCSPRSMPPPATAASASTARAARPAKPSNPPPPTPRRYRSPPRNGVPWRTRAAPSARQVSRDSGPRRRATRAWQTGPPGGVTWPRCSTA
ncbi:MAG: hypothetical protein H6694_07385 [Candidatus Latescibacteria bacterium]|nr:hypothetical protein [Candidatus Latescibacterota bacterium]